jgi:hypothetical protein
LLTAEGLLLNSAGVVVQLAKANEIATTPKRRAINVIFTENPSVARRHHLIFFCHIKLHLQMSLMQP